MKALLPTAIALLALPVLAAAHPHKADPDTHTAETEKRWLFFGDRDATGPGSSDAEDVVKRRVIIRKSEDGESETVDSFSWDGDELTDMAKDLEAAIAESGVLSDMARMLSDLAEEVEIERGESGGTALRIAGEEMLRFKLDRNRSVDEALSITGLGRNLTVERETIVEDGKTRTRIVIEMDGGEDVELALPERD